MLCGSTRAGGETAGLVGVRILRGIDGPMGNGSTHQRPSCARSRPNRTAYVTSSLRVRVLPKNIEGTINTAFFIATYCGTPIASMSAPHQASESGEAWRKLSLPPELHSVLDAAPSVAVASTVSELVELAAPEGTLTFHEVAYDVPGRGRVVEAQVCRVRNGIAANYVEPYMRRRDPECMVIGDEKPTNKVRFSERFGTGFDSLRAETFAWLKTQDLAVFAFTAGVEEKGVDAFVVAPANAGFFAMGLALLQGIRPMDEVGPDFDPKAVLYIAPPFRHTHFDGRQVVVHNRTEKVHELFSYNLYPGPSAKKGIYGVLLTIGEQEGWVTAHCATVEVTTPYDNTVAIMHEGASGGGKSEMLEQIHREEDGTLLLGENVVTGEPEKLALPRGCELAPVTDDMALCPNHIQDRTRQKKLVLMDAEEAWFIRVNHIAEYGTDPHLERLTAHPPEPLLFLNIDAPPGSRALIFEHIEDAPGQPCPNPRVVVPRRIVPGVKDGHVRVDIRSFGVRTPPCTKEQPSYGIIGLFHVLPPALAWLWRLVAPRGHANPSITDTVGMTSEGVGSYWPFATGRRVDQANLLLEQILRTTDTLFILCPNQHVGAWKTGFMPQWIAREYLARRGSARFRSHQLEPSRCPLLGYALNTLQVEGTRIDQGFLRVETQPEVGEAAYDTGAKKLVDFFAQQLELFQHPDLHPQGKVIIARCLAGAGVHEFARMTENAALPPSFTTS